MRTKLIYIGIALLLLVGCGTIFYAGVLQGKSTPKIVTVTEQVPPIVTTLPPIVTTQIVDVPVLASQVIKDFPSLDALNSWLSTDNTHLQQFTSSFTCIDFAEMMSEHAYQDGFWIFPAADFADGHMLCMTEIGNTLYAIEPQTNAVTEWAEKEGN